MGARTGHRTAGQLMTTFITVALNNTGTVEIQGGTLALTGAGVFRVTNISTLAHRHFRTRQ